jgi:hypothetical protein
MTYIRKLLRAKDYRWFEASGKILADQLSSYYHPQNQKEIERLLEKRVKKKLYESKVRILEYGTYIHYDRSLIPATQAYINLNGKELKIDLYYKGNVESHLLEKGDGLIFRRPECVSFTAHSDMKVAILDYYDNLLQEAEAEKEEKSESEIVVVMAVKTLVQ